MTTITTTGDKIKEMMSLFSICNNPVRLKFTTEGLKFAVIDPSNTALMNGVFAPAYFTAYQAAEEDIFIDVKNFDTVLKRLKKDSATLNISEGEIEIKEKNTTWKVRPIECEDIPPIPKIDPENSITMDAATFISEVERIADVGDAMRFNITDDGMSIEGIDGYKTPVTTSIPRDQFKTFAICAPAKAGYTTTYITDLMKGLPKGMELALRIDSDYPMRIDLTTEDKTCKISYFLAPRLEEEGL